MKRLGLLVIFACSLIYGISPQYLHADGCVDETDQEGGDCKTSKCAIPCDGSGQVLGLQTKQQGTPFLNITRTANSQSDPAWTKEPLPARASYISADARTALSLSDDLLLDTPGGLSRSGESRTAAPPSVIFKKAADIEDICQRNTWRRV
jgi:hypothetical protein